MLFSIQNVKAQFNLFQDRYSLPKGGDSAMFAGHDTRTGTTYAMNNTDSINTQTHKIAFDDSGKLIYEELYSLYSDAIAEPELLLSYKREINYYTNGEKKYELIEDALPDTSIAVQI